MKKTHLEKLKEHYDFDTGAYSMIQLTCEAILKDIEDYEKMYDISEIEDTFGDIKELIKKGAEGK